MIGSDEYQELHCIFVSKKIRLSFEYHTLPCKRANYLPNSSNHVISFCRKINVFSFNNIACFVFSQLTNIFTASNSINLQINAATNL